LKFSSKFGGVVRGNFCGKAYFVHRVAVFQAGVILHHKVSWELEFNNVGFAVIATISM